MVGRVDGRAADGESSTQFAFRREAGAAGHSAVDDEQSDSVGERGVVRLVIHAPSRDEFHKVPERDDAANHVTTVLELVSGFATSREVG